MTTITFKQNVSGYTGTIDTYLRESRPTSSYDTAVSVYADGSDSAGAQIQGLLSFANIFGNGLGQIPLGSTITSATLTVTLSDGTTSPFTFHRMAQDWTALSSWTWNSFGAGVQTDGVEALSTADVSLVGLGTGAQSIDVMQSLRAWSEGAANYGWLLINAGADGFAFNSAQSLNAPQLTVTYEAPTVPQPGLLVTESGGTTAVTEGGSGDTIVIALKSAPTSDVTITVSTSGPDDISIVQSVLIFTVANWQQQQSIVLGAINDSLVEGAETFTVTMTATSADGGYNGLNSNVSVQVTDDDTPPLPTVLSPAVVAIHNAALYTAGDASLVPGCGDPSGIAYVPGLDRLFIVDSEHDEKPYNSQTNLFVTTLDGTHVASYSLRSFTREPTGIAYNPLNGLLYITDDDANKIFIANPVNPAVLVGTIDLNGLGITDAEDPKIDPVTGHIYMLDGLTRRLIELTATGALVQETTLPVAIKEAEALAYDPARDVFYIGSGANRGTIYQTDHDGQILASISLLNSYVNPSTGSRPKIKGLELAPSSDPNDGNTMSLYACDYGTDQSLDGRIFEIDLYHNWQVLL
jgi:hypothetical protein